MDAVVLARSAFHHSVNYRSAVIFGKPEKVTDHSEVERALEAFTNKMQPGRWEDVRKPTTGEWKATMVLSFIIQEASAKVRTGNPVDEEDDYELEIWAGIVPLNIQRQPPLADLRLKKDIPMPDYLKKNLSHE